jgi:hypothetical protein
VLLLLLLLLPKSGELQLPKDNEQNRAQYLKLLCITSEFAV